MAWTTTFYYEQELRSLFMNGLINASFRPGIYNGDVGIYTTNSDESSIASPGIYATIKKGTTFLFSNGYKSTSDGYVRDPDSLGTFMIKAVCTADTTVKLAALEGTSSSSATALIGNGSSVLAEKKIFLGAVMEYKSGETVNQQEPNFFLAIPRPNRTSGQSYYTVLDNSNLVLPDGTNDSETAGYISYAFLGMVGLTKDTYYGSGAQWATSSESTRWINEHYFTCRGLPDFRQAITAMGTSTPDVMLNPTCNILYEDLGTIYEDDNIFVHNQDWMGVYGINTSTTPAVGDYGYTVVDLEENYNKTTTAQLAEISATNKVLMDVVFLYNDNKLSNTSADVKSLFESGSPAKPYKSTIGTKHIRIASANGFSDTSIFNPTAASTEFTSATHRVIPLDVGKYNLNRLLGVISDRNIIPIIIDTLRTNNFFTAESGTSLTPLALMFRGYTTDWIEGVSSTTTVHPGNILSFADVQFKSNKIESFKLRDDNTFSILPVLN